MMIKERWGKEYIDMRDWPSYNEELVVRGNFYLDVDWVKDWDKELKRMNICKKGSPFVFPESLIRLQAIWHQWVDYRGVEGIARMLAEHGLIPEYNDFSTINRRVNRTVVDFQLPREGEVNVSTDGTSVKFGNGGEYRERKYGNGRKKYIKVTITADPLKRKLLDADVDIEGEGDSEADVAKKHMEGLKNKGKKIKKFWGDGLFDSNELFNYLDENGIESAVKIRKNAVETGNGSARNKEVRKYMKKGYKKWAKEREYGQRWNGTEGIISAVKRKFGENVRSTKLVNMLKEAKMKFWAYDVIKEYAKNAVCVDN